MAQLVNQFVKRTGYNINQFLGRKMLNVQLPNELDESDLLAVAKIHFPDLDADYLELIAAKAMQSESYLMAVEAVAKRARYIARRDNHPAVTLEDLELAISEVLPGTVDAAVPPEATGRSKKRLARVVDRTSEPLAEATRIPEPLAQNRISVGRQTHLTAA